MPSAHSGAICCTKAIHYLPSIVYPLLLKRVNSNAKKNMICRPQLSRFHIKLYAPIHKPAVAIFQITNMAQENDRQIRNLSCKQYLHKTLLFRILFTHFFNKPIEYANANARTSAVNMELQR
jgi:hypothetical protein